MNSNQKMTLLSTQTSVIFHPLTFSSQRASPLTPWRELWEGWILCCCCCCCVGCWLTVQASCSVCHTVCAPITQWDRHKFKSKHWETFKILLHYTGAWEISLVLDGRVTAVYTKAISAAKPVISHFWTCSMCTLQRSRDTARPQDGAVVSLSGQRKTLKHPEQLI